VLLLLLLQREAVWGGWQELLPLLLLGLPLRLLLRQRLLLLLQWGAVLGGW